MRFDSDGNPVERFDQAYIPGKVELFLGQRRVLTLDVNN
jgi:hypothetical protein